MSRKFNLKVKIVRFGYFFTILGKIGPNEVIRLDLANLTAFKLPIRLTPRKTKYISYVKNRKVTV
jgi:hypothetical protein